MTPHQDQDQSTRMRSPDQYIRTRRRRAPCTSQTSSRKWRPLLLLQLVLVACCFPSSQGFGKGSRRSTRISKRLWKELSDLYNDPAFTDDNKNNTDPTNGTVVKDNTITEEEPPSDSRGFFHGLWRRGVKTSLGVRSNTIIHRTDLFVRRGSTNHPLSHVDRWARSLGLSLAWVVSFQTLGTVMVAYRESLYEVCVRAFVCVLRLWTDLLFCIECIPPD
jgi:hypothetical protein